MDPITAFLISITSTLGTSGMSLIYGYVSGIAVNLLSGKLERGWEQRAQAAAQLEAELFQQIESARPLREEISRIAVNATRVAAKLGHDPQASAVLGLLQDPLFQIDLGRWILASNADDEKIAADCVARRIMQQLQIADIGEPPATMFSEAFFDSAQRLVFSQPEIIAWRADLRIIQAQAMVQAQATWTHELILDSSAQILEALDRHLGPLLPTSADDVKKLRDHRDTHIELVKRTSRIVVDDVDVKIDRVVVQHIVQAAIDGSLLLTGDPGSGKSIALIDSVIELRRQGFDVVYLDIQRLSAESLGELRTELGLSFPIDHVMSDWPGRDKLILCLDGLDAARSTPTGSMVRDLIQQSLNAKRWNVIASIRKFDMRYAHDLKKLFAGQSASSQFYDQEFRSLRHISVPPLSDDELGSFSEKSPSLSKLIDKASDELLNQLRTPFNIWLAADVINSGAEPGIFAEIRTQLQLLELYWQHRVIRNDGFGDAREAIAFEAASQMVVQCELRTSRSSVAKDPAASQPLDDLLSSNVLAEWTPPGTASPTRYALAFPHNTLFDYVASLALFEEDPDRLLDALKRDAALLLFVLPSIRFFYRNSGMSHCKATTSFP